MDERAIYERLTAIFREVLGHDHVTLGAGTTAREVPGWDSFNHLSILVAAELAFGIKFHTGEVGRLRNAGELVALIARKMAAR